LQKNPFIELDGYIHAQDGRQIDQNGHIVVISIASF
jgi:hypothetical protein